MADTNLNHQSSNAAPYNKLSLNTIVLTAVSVILVAIIWMDPFRSLTNDFYNMEELENQDYHFVIYFDGGSTGTRVHIFKFFNHSGGQINLISEIYQHTQPGLSSYASNPEKAAESLIPLLEKAETSIPRSKWEHTPVVLKATAGLRLLPEKTAADILNQVQNVFTFSPFKYTLNCVSILEDTDEGLFAWQTVNFLLGKTSAMKETVATLDLGGGSTQVTFSPEILETVLLSPADHILEMPTSHKPMYTKSYLGFGLMSARLGTVLLSNKGHQVVNQEGLVVMETSCFYPGSSKKWSYNGTNYLIRNSNSSSFGYHACNQYVKRFLTDQIFIPSEIQQQNIYALSYYYDRAIDAAIIEKRPRVRVIVNDFRLAAKRICSELNEPSLFLCLDLTYISSLLHIGLGLDYHKEIFLSKKIEGVEASWVLGAAFQYLS